MHCDQEECLREVAHSTAGRLGLPTGVTAVEKSQANGRAEQHVRVLRGRSKIIVEDARRRGVEIILDHLVAQRAVRSAEWIQNFFVQSDVDLSEGGTKKITPYGAHSGDKAPSNVVGFLERVLVRIKINDDKQPRFLVGWALGHKDADVVTLMEDGSVRKKRFVEIQYRKDAVMQTFMNFRMRSQRPKTTKLKVQDCLACEHGINVKAWSETHV